MRCYNGCPDSELQALIDDSAKATQELKAIGAHATYFPVEDQWMVFKDYQPLTGFHGTKRQATNSALRNGEES